MFRVLTSLHPQVCKAAFTATSSLMKAKNPALIENARNICISSKLLCCRPTIQKPAPDFSGTAVVHLDFKEIKLSDYKGKYVVLFFYPLDFTFVCPTELIAFNERISEFNSLNTQVIGVSTDSQYSHLAWIKLPKKEGGLGGSLNYPLLSDFNKEISKKYEVLVEDAGVALRGLFIIDKDGILRQFSINDLPVGRSVDETLRLLKAFLFVEKHGEVCPANWQPESKTIKPTPKDSKEYFESVN
ncbi:peroxiredoxin-like isoform X1 [Colletes gigas]|uniref:peroxiredoxin-like isoform X1 n=2 Tax=Colletes gigas TaxID=935657 RepID=UPI001C9B2A56|nr:peroxiredoxin-like isoform X1 [Colletes gigas]